MVGLVGLLVVLVLLLIFLTLPLSDWRELWRWLKGRRPGSRLVRALSAGWQRPKRLLERVRAGRVRPGRRPEEAGPAPKPGRPSYQERVGRPVAREMARAQGAGAGKASPPSPKKKAPVPVSSREAPVVRWPFRLLLLLVLLLGLFISLYPLLASRLAAEPPHHLTLLVAVGQETAESEQLLQDLRSLLNEEGLTHTVSLRAVPRPSTPEAAYAQVSSHPADFLLWGDPLPGGGYALTLTLHPRPDPEQPELNEYLQVMVTPPHFPLSRKSGLTAKEVSPLLAWLARFYLGEFEWTTPQEFSSDSPFPDVLEFHQAGLLFLRGEYDRAAWLYADLAGYDSARGFYEVGPPSSLASAPEEALRTAALNNGAVAWLQEAELRGNVSSEGAVFFLEEAARKAPENSVILYNLGRAYLGRHKWSLAVEALQKALEGRPNDARTLALLSQACCGAGDAACARERARQALEAAPNLPEAHLAMACYHLGRVDPGEAGREVERSIRLAEEESKRRRVQEIALRSVPVPNLTWVAYRAAWTARSLPLLARSRLFQARRYLVEFYSKPPPGFGEYLWTLVFGEESPLDRAQEELDRAAEVLREGYEALCLRGEIALARGQLEEAAAFFLQAQEEDGSDREAYLRLAEVYLRQWRAFQEAGREDEAVESLSRASEQYRRLVDEGIDPVQGYLGLGEVLQRSGQDEEAFWEYRWATDIDPNCAEAYLRMGLVERKQGWEVEALEHFTLAAKFARGEVLLAAEVERGSILLERYLGAEAAFPSRELLNEARSAFERAVRATEEGFRYDTSGVAIRPAVSYGANYEARALCGLGRIAYEGGDYAKAERQFQEALRKTPNFFEALYGLGRVYLAQKEGAEKALEYLQRAVEQSPESIAANYYLGEAYSLQLQENRARRTYEKVLRLCQEGKAKRADDEKACDRVRSRLQGLSVPR